MRVIQRERLPFHPRLGRNVNHDSASRAYRIPIKGRPLVSRRYLSTIGILDQGSLGACTGMSGVSAIYHEPFNTNPNLERGRYSRDLGGAIALYSAATRLDPFQGSYPPDDTGSDGLSVAKALKAANVIKGYRWAFTLAEALDALMDTPLLTGVNFYRSMFHPDPVTGIMTIDRSGGLSGGHEMCVDEYVAPEDSPTGWALVGGPNSWGVNWGRGGRWYLSVGDWESLLAERGDVTQFVPHTWPTPVPNPLDSEDPAGDELWAAARDWASGRKSYGRAASAQLALRQWAERTGRQ
jgi:hypothetical protein